MNLSSPNRMVWHYFAALRRLTHTLDSVDETAVKENAAVCIMLAVTVVETFVNVLFRVVVTEPGFTDHKEYILRDLRKRVSIDHKLKKWPARVFGAPLEPNEAIFEAFLALKERRNKLMHFTSSHESLDVDNVEIQGLADTSAFDELKIADAVNALAVAEDMVCLLLRLRGVPEDRLQHGLHLWTGRVPLRV